MGPTRLTRRRILIIEDDPANRELLTYNFVLSGYQVREAATGERGLSMLAVFTPDVILLDLMLPDLPGTEICRRIRSRADGPQPAIIMVTGKGEERDRVGGFEVGADDYVVKPFSLRELSLRVNALLQGRSGETTGSSRRAPRPIPRGSRRRFTVGPLRVDVDGHYVFVEGKEVHVSAIEMRLLVCLIEQWGRVRLRENLLEEVWGYKPSVPTRTVDTHVKRLRDKLGPAGELIETVRGTGYRLSDAYPILLDADE